MGFYTSIGQVFEAGNGRDNARWLISGKRFDRDDDYPYGGYRRPRRRTVMGFLNTESRNQVILMVTGDNSQKTVPELQEDLESFGYDTSNIIVLYGSNSTTMRVDNGSGINYFGTDGWRTISNMVSLINT